jgi:hypothetical protein
MRPRSPRCEVRLGRLKSALAAVGGGGVGVCWCSRTLTAFFSERWICWNAGFWLERRLEPKAADRRTAGKSVRYEYSLRCSCLGPQI